MFTRRAQAAMPTPVRRNTPYGRRAVASIACAVLACLLGITAPACRAESVMRGDSGSARLTFKIVIPSVLILDTRTGTVFSNDPKAVPMIGMTAAAQANTPERGAMIQRAGIGNAKGLHVVGSRAAPVRVAARLGEGEVLCIP